MIPIEYHNWFSIAVTVGVFALIQFRKNLALDWVFMWAIVLVMFGGVITPAEAFSGFSNPAVIAIGGLIALAAGLRRCGVLDWMGKVLLGDVTTAGGANSRMALFLMPISAFLLNTAVVAMFAPMLSDWCRRNRISSSQVMIPLSYLAILGGVCTLVGTSTTLVVNAKLQEISSNPQGKYPESYKTEMSKPVNEVNTASKPTQHRNTATKNPKLKPLGMFEIGWVGVPCAIAGSIVLLVLCRRILPKRKSAISQFDSNTKEYHVDLIVMNASPIVGKTVMEAGLRNLPGLFLVEIDRQDEIISPVRPNDRIHAQDRLVFTGILETIIDLEKVPGLVPATDTEQHVSLRNDRQRQLTEVVLSPTSPMLGKTIQDANFRQYYDAAILAVHRNGSRVLSKIGQIVLEPGDTLLLQSTGNFAKTWGQSRDFYLVNAVGGYSPPELKKLPIGLSVFGCFLLWLILVGLFGWSGETAFGNPAPLAVLALLLFVTTRCMTMSEARNAVDLRLVITIAGALGLATALDKSGGASLVANFVTNSVGNNPWLLLLTIYFLTNLLTEVLTNNAVAALMLPIAIRTAEWADISPRPFIIAVTLAASLSFLTPIGYQTNLMVMGPGGYKPSDFLKMGLPIALTVGISAVILIPQIWPF